MHYFNRVTLLDLCNRRSGGCDQKRLPTAPSHALTKSSITHCYFHGLHPLDVRRSPRRAREVRLQTNRAHLPRSRANLEVVSSGVGELGGSRQSL